MGVNVTLLYHSFYFFLCVIFIPFIFNLIFFFIFFPSFLKKKHHIFQLSLLLFLVVFSITWCLSTPGHSNNRIIWSICRWGNLNTNPRRKQNNAISTFTTGLMKFYYQMKSPSKTNYSKKSWCGSHFSFFFKDWVTSYQLNLKPPTHFVSIFISLSLSLSLSLLLSWPHSVSQFTICIGDIVQVDNFIKLKLNWESEKS